MGVEILDRAPHTEKYSFTRKKKKFFLHNFYLVMDRKNETVVTKQKLFQI